MNGIYREEMSWRPSAMYIDTWSKLATRKGDYAETLRVDGKTRLLRSPDGVHVAKEGAEILVKHVLPRAKAFLNERPHPRRSLNDATCAAVHADSRGVPLRFR